MHELELSHVPHLTDGILNDKIGRCLYKTALGILQLGLVFKVQAGVPQVVPLGSSLGCLLGIHRIMFRILFFGFLSRTLLSLVKY